MSDSVKSASESSDDEEYIPPAKLLADYVEESSEDSDDKISDGEVGKGVNAKMESKLLKEKDRDEIWTDFLEKTKPMVTLQIFTYDDQLEQPSSHKSRETQAKSNSTHNSLPAVSFHGVKSNSHNSSNEKVGGLGLKRPASSTGNRLADALKRLKSSTLSSGVPKISVLVCLILKLSSDLLFKMAGEKSRQDWESFTEKEGIKDDLKLHNKGKNGYVERKAFEARTQEREYQILKEARLKSIQRR
ncbi:Craniofacial development protein [Echinococcus granulosus]|uniref:Craniofacial development protein 1 n=1 Tax=Echinococcus granulosus TaxID=6210 RepID=W6UL85_ECHGR|nr:Craniofacial development protein [Echinococcus granulosus]EUB58867.1 Craniofacial development protein [Echinococcus granulosus]